MNIAFTAAKTLPYTGHFSWKQLARVLPVWQVAPECVDRELILPGGSEEEARRNAEYAISCAHKAGCAMFLGWRDIVQVQPRMILCLLAAAMSLELRREQGVSHEGV